MIRFCANCGAKIFIGAQGWGYAYDGKYTCTYKCMREMRLRDRVLMQEEKKPEVDRLAAEGKTVTEIAEAMQIPMMQVRGYLAGKSRWKKKTDGATGDTSSVTLRVTPSPEGKAYGEPDAGTKSDLAAVVELMREMLDIISRMIGAE